MHRARIRPCIQATPGVVDERDAGRNSSRRPHQCLIYRPRLFARSVDDDLVKPCDDEVHSATHLDRHLMRDHQVPVARPGGGGIGGCGGDGSSDASLRHCPKLTVALASAPFTGRWSWPASWLLPSGASGASVGPGVEMNAAAADPTPSFSTNSLRFIRTSQLAPPVAQNTVSPFADCSNTRRTADMGCA